MLMRKLKPLYNELVFIGKVLKGYSILTLLKTQ